MYPASWSKIDLHDPQLYYSIGLHPHLISSVTTDPSFFLQYLKEPRCVGFWEIGLDYTTTCRCSSHCGRNEKKDCVKRKIRKQVKFLEHMLPLIPEDVVIVVHTNGEGAANDMIEILIKGRKTKQGIHWHCFMGDSSLANRLLQTFPCLFLSFSSGTRYCRSQSSGRSFGVL